MPKARPGATEVGPCPVEKNPVWARVNVNAFGVVNVKLGACAFNSTVDNRQYSMAYASFLSPDGVGT